MPVKCPERARRVSPGQAAFSRVALGILQTRSGCPVGARQGLNPRDDRDIADRIKPMPCPFRAPPFVPHRVPGRRRWRVLPWADLPCPFRAFPKRSIFCCIFLFILPSSLFASSRDRRRERGEASLLPQKKPRFFSVRARGNPVRKLRLEVHHNHREIRGADSGNAARLPQVGWADFAELFLRFDAELRDRGIIER